MRHHLCSHCSFPMFCPMLFKCSLSYGSYLGTLPILVNTFFFQIMKYFNCTGKSIEIEIYLIHQALSEHSTSFVSDHFFPTYKMFWVCLKPLYVTLLDLLCLFLLGPCPQELTSLLAFFFPFLFYSVLFFSVSFSFFFSHAGEHKWNIVLFLLIFKLYIKVIIVYVSETWFVFIPP